MSTLSVRLAGLKMAANRHVNVSRSISIPRFTIFNDEYELFTDKLITTWVDQKARLKKLIKLHLQPSLKLREWQKMCWESHTKVTEASSMLEAAEVSLKSELEHTIGYRARKIAIRALNRDLSTKQRKHIRDLRKFDEALDEECIITREMYEISDSLRSSMTSRIKEKLDEALEQLQEISTPLCGSRLDVDTIATSIYDFTSRTYRYEEPGPVFTSNVIIRPYSEDSPYEPADSEHKYGSSNYTGTVTDSFSSSSEHYLKLKPGDIVRLKMTSADGKIGFGWIKRSTFSWKKWGFFPTSKVKFNMTADS